MSERPVTSWYSLTANPAPDRPVLRGEIGCDVAVLGGGYTGLTAALHLAERGFDVVVVEGKQVGWGASGRNGGQIVTGYNPSMTTLAGLVGDNDTRKLWEMAEEAKRLLIDTVSRYGIACGLSWGYLFVAERERQLRGLAALEQEWAHDFGYGGLRAVGHDELRQMVGSKRYLGGLYDAGAGHLHPLNYVRGLAQACSHAGVRIFEGSQVIKVNDGAKPALVTAQGAVRARFLVLGGNAWMGKLVPALARKIASVDTYIVATERLPRARIRSVLRDDIAVSDANFVLNYFRRTPDDRLLFGARANYSGFEPPGLRIKMRRAMLHVFPQLADIRLEQLWGGRVDITMNRTPHFGRLGQSTYFAQGFSGQGVALTGMAGKLIAEAIAGQAERFDVFARIPHASFPGGLLRRPALALGMLWYRLRDLL
jgi:gamma-glutamylputrescine oxidase